MDNATQEQIIEAEARLAKAMKGSDVDALDALIAPELVFTTHFGQVIGKEDDLEAHRSKLFVIEVLELSDRRMVPAGDAVVVSVQARIAGRYGEAAVDSLLRFTRVWSRSEGAWRVVAGHACEVAQG